MSDNPTMRTFQFAAMQRAEVMARLVRSGRGHRATVVLDLEDGLWEVTDEAKIGARMSAGRANLVTFACPRPELFAGRPIGVRIYRISGPDAELDLEALAEASRFVEFECIIPTKVEVADELHHIAGASVRRAPPSGPSCPLSRLVA